MAIGARREPSHPCGHGGDPILNDGSQPRIHASAFAADELVTETRSVCSGDCLQGWFENAAAAAGVPQVRPGA